METDPSAGPTDQRLNELYWNSGRTVDEIVEQFAIGRNTLYDAIEPEPAGGRCAACGGALVFTNRTSRAAGLTTCTSCGAEADAYAPAEAVGGRWGNRLVTGGVSRWRRDLDIEPRRAALIGGAAALGMMMGSAAVLNLRD